MFCCLCSLCTVQFILDKSLALLGRIDIIHGSETLAEMPRLLTSPGALVQLYLPAVSGQLLH